MPQVAIGAALGAAASTGFALFTGSVALSGAASFFMASFVRSFVIGAVMQALQDKPDFNANDQGITLTNRSSTATRKLVYGKRRVGGTIVFIGTEDEKDGEGNVVKANQFLHMVIALAGHRIDGIENVYFNEEVISTDAKTFTAADSEYSLALDAGTNYSDADILIKALPGGNNQAVPAELISGFPDDYTSDHQLNETAYLYVRMKYNQEIFSTGIPNITATIRGKHVNDPRDSSYQYSNNAALCVLDYLIESTERYGLGVAIPEVDLTTFIDAANVCDESVTLEAGGTEPRYTVNGVIDSAVEPRQNIENMLTSMNGKLVYVKGLFQIFPGVYRTPSETITTSELIDSVSISTKTSTRQLFNGVKGTFADPTQNYILTEYPSVESSTYQTIDGYTSFQTLDLPFTTSSATAQRLAKLALNRSRQETIISMQCNLSAIDIVPGDFIYVTNEELGFDQKVFEVVASGLAVNSDGTLGVSISAQEASAATFDWQASDEQAIITADTVYRRTYAIQAPSNLNVTSSAVVNGDGTVQSKITISFSESTTRNVQYYELQWKLTSDTTYNSVSIGNRNEIEFTGGVIPGQNYNFRVRAIATNGAASPFAETTHVMAGDTTAPSAPTGLTAVGGFQLVTLDWTGNSEDDLRGYFVYENSSNSFGSANQIAFVSADQFTRGGLSASQTKYYWVTAVDFSGNESSQSGVASATTNADPQDGEDGLPGEDGPRNATGYVFYQIQQSGSPGTPSASSYNFSNGTFSGLTANWDESVSVQTPEEGKNYWASRYSVVESSFGGAQSISFTSAFVWQNFDGLVTFTNIQDGINNNVTTIDGGNVDLVNLNADNITTGTISADNVSGGTIDVGSGGLVVSSNVGEATFGGTNFNGTIGRFRRNSSTFLPPVYCFDASSDVATEMFWVQASGAGASIFGQDSSGSYRSLYVSGTFNGASSPTLEVVSKTSGQGGIKVTNTYSGGDGHALRALCTPGSSSAILATGNGFAVFAESGGYGPFTGVHQALISDVSAIEAGDIVIDSQIVIKKGISDTLSEIVMSSAINQKSALGVYVDHTDIEQSSLIAAAVHEVQKEVESKDSAANQTTEMVTSFEMSDETYQMLSGYLLASVNSVGEGQINVCGQAGDIETGDLIVTSDMAGKGMKQADDIVRGYTVAKARESVTFSSPDEVKQIACIYLCG